MLKVLEIRKRDGKQAKTDRDTIEGLLPDNYALRYETEELFIVLGEDLLGWNAKDYVIPRLASGLITARDVTDLIKEERGPERLPGI